MRLDLYKLQVLTGSEVDVLPMLNPLHIQCHENQYRLMTTLPNLRLSLIIFTFCITVVTQSVDETPKTPSLALIKNEEADKASVPLAVLIGCL